MRILILGFTKLKYMPYMHFYLDNISTTANDVEILYWNRDQKPEDLNAYSDYILHEFNYYQDDQVPPYEKIGAFLKYRRFALQVINANHYDYIIVLHTLPGVLIADKLKQYKVRFILDYRDSTYEGFAPFKAVVGKLVKWSSTTFVSSDAFRKYLPQEESKKIITSHNILVDSLKHQDDKVNYGINSDKIRVAFWGFIRHKEVNIQLIDRLANDSRFELHYYGREQQVALDLKKYSQDIKACNVFFHGEYAPEDRYEFIKKTDIIHNLYLDKNTLLAMGNKFYDGIIFGIPQLCMPGSFMGEMCEKYNVGTTLDPQNSDFADKLFQYITDINLDNFNSSCKDLLSIILREYNLGCEIVKSIK